MDAATCIRFLNGLNKIEAINISVLGIIQST